MDLYLVIFEYTFDPEVLRVWKNKKKAYKDAEDARNGLSRHERETRKYYVQEICTED